MIIPWLLLQFQVAKALSSTFGKTQAEGNLCQFFMAIWDGFGFILWSLSITNSWSLIFWVHKLGILYTSPWKVESAPRYPVRTGCPVQSLARRHKILAEVLIGRRFWQGKFYRLYLWTITEFMDSTLQCVFCFFWGGLPKFRQAPITYLPIFTSLSTLFTLAELGGLLILHQSGVECHNGHNGHIEIIGLLSWAQWWLWIRDYKGLPDDDLFK